ncbi:MAG: tetratricopeptide repeat-containing glycosyltransferase family protein [Verrucomicrobiota bacterium]
MNPEAIRYAQQGAEAQEQGRLQEALEFYLKAVAIDVTLSGLASNLGVVLTDLGAFDKAEQVFKEAIRVDASNPAVWNNRGNLWKKQKVWNRALDDYSTALQLKADYVNAWYNRGTVHFALNQLTEAENDLQEALNLDPFFAKAWVNLGEVRWELNRGEDAMRCFESAIASDEENAEAHWNRSLWYLWKGDYQKGWPEYEWRWALPGILPFYSELPLWRGEEEVHLLVYAEQGYGDTIQFSRFLREVKKRVRTLTVDVQDSLLPWLRSFYPEIEFVGSSGFPKTVTHRVALQSLPLVLGIESPRNQDSQRTSLQTKNEKIRQIGFCWTGSEVDLRRRCLLELWKPLFDLPGIEWVSFQAGRVTQELKTISHSIEDWGSGFQNFQETAEALQKVDLVITIDTALAHLAGTIGKPTWILLPHVADWRWGESGDRCDWYESVRCFRQSTRGDWADVIERVRCEFQKQN